jgi:hypothetical protein
MTNPVNAPARALIRLGIFIKTDETARIFAVPGPGRGKRHL